MQDKSPLLSAEKRERIGTRYCDRYRKKGKLPAIVYGHGRDPLAIVVDTHQTMGLINKGEKVFRLDFPGHSEADEKQMVLLKDVQFDYMGSKVVHCDFARVDLNERIHTKVHINLVGEAIGLKIAGNLLMHPVTEIEIECRVADIPGHIDVDISALELGQVITTGDVKLPKADMKLISDTHGAVAQIVMGVELKVAEATTVAAEGAASPEVLTAKKEEGAAGAKPAAGAAKPAAPKK
jgi:large subunit ribosomal protein L25